MGGARTAYLVSCSTRHLSQGERLGLGVVSALVGSLLGLCLWLSFKRGDVVQAGTATAGWCMRCSAAWNIFCAKRELGWSAASYRVGAIPGGVVSLTSSALSSAVFEVSCWNCACRCELVCVFIRVMWAASCVTLLESVGSEKGIIMVVGEQKKV